MVFMRSLLISMVSLSTLGLLGCGGPGWKHVITVDPFLPQTVCRSSPQPRISLGAPQSVSSSHSVVHGLPSNVHFQGSDPSYYLGQPGTNSQVITNHQSPSPMLPVPAQTAPPQQLPKPGIELAPAPRMIDRKPEPKPAPMTEIIDAKPHELKPVPAAKPEEPQLPKSAPQPVPLGLPTPNQTPTPVPAQPANEQPEANRTTEGKTQAHLVRQVPMPLETPIPRDDATNVTPMQPMSPAPTAARVLPELSLTKAGPTSVQVGRDVEHTLTVQNRGKVPATRVELIDYLPPQLALEDRPAGATVETGEVRWQLGTLQPGEQRVVAIRTRAREAADRVTNRATVTCDEGAGASASCTVRVESSAALRIDFSDAKHGVHAGTDLDYQIRISNPMQVGIRNLRVWVEMSEHLQPRAEQAMMIASPGNRRLEFPMSDLAPGETKVYRARARSVRTGNAQVRVVAGNDEVGMISEELHTSVVQIR